MNKKIIFEGNTKSGINYQIRLPNKNDALKMHEFINKLSSEKTFINLQGEKISLVEEKKYLIDQIKRIAKNQSVELVVEANSKIIGASTIDLGEGASSAEGALEISLLENYRNHGIGGKLLDLILNEAKKIKNLKVITLTLFGNNNLAYDLYKKRGFKEFGRLPEGVLFKGKYYDRIYMFKVSQ